MRDLWTALGYDVIASEIAHAMRDGTAIDVIDGPPGVGKSWLAKGIGALWEASGGSAIVAEGDTLHSDVALYPLGFAMAGLSSGWRDLGAGLAATTRAGEKLIGTGGIVTGTVEAAARLRRKRRRARKLYLGDAEQAILFQLERLGRKRPLLLVADNLHWWDTASLQLLARLRNERMGEAFPFLVDLRVLAVRTVEPYQQVAHPEAYDALLTPMSTRHHRLSRVPRTSFQDVLSVLGATPYPSQEASDAVYALSGGHLALAHQFAKRMALGETETLLAAADFDEFVRKLLAERINSLGVLGAEAVALLQVAAVLGLSFRRDELACVVGRADPQTSRVLRYCRDEDVLELTDSVGKFVHDLYRQHFLSIAAAEKASIHERLSRCLQTLRPGDYELRCLNARDAERHQDAGVLGVHASIQRVRDGRDWQDVAAPVKAAIERAGLGEVVASFMLALDDLNHYRFHDCRATLDRLPRGLARSLVAEADYLRAMCLMSTRSEDDRAVGRGILEAWSGYEDDEAELGIRILQLLLYGMSHLINKEPGRLLEARIRRVLSGRASLDLAAKDALYTLDRCSGTFYPPDVSLIRTREAATYYGPSDEHSVLRRPAEYYRCAVNLCAKLISNARYVEAQVAHAEVERLIAEYVAGTFPRVEHARMNGLLADYRTGDIIPAVAVERQREIAEAITAESDPFYVRNALAVYLSLDDRPDEALAIFDELARALETTRRDPEPSMVYLIRANRAAALYVAGNVEAAQAHWTELRPIVERIAYETRPILVHRHARLGAVMAEARAMSAQDFDRCLLVDRPIEIGPLWDNFGRGFRMPEVEFWRDN